MEPAVASHDSAVRQVLLRCSAVHAAAAPPHRMQRRPPGHQHRLTAVVSRAAIRRTRKSAHADSSRGRARPGFPCPRSGAAIA
jgi:hypothetical protein